MMIIKVNDDFFDGKINNFSDISYWYVMLNDRNEPIKEIGFSIVGKVLYKAPSEKDFGFLTDSPIFFENPADFEMVTSKVFNSFWDPID